MRIRPLIVFLVATLPACVPAQVAPAKWADTLAREIDSAYLAGDSARLKAAVALAERVASAYPDDGLVQYYRAYGLYRSATRGENPPPDAPSLLASAEHALEQSIASHDLPESHAMLSAIYGQQIRADPSQKMQLGMASQGEMQQAMTRGPTNPRVWLLRGMSTIFTPPEYGGGLDPAAEQLTRAIALFEKDAPKPGEPRWGRVDAYTWLGYVYQQQGDKTKAADMFHRALALAPRFPMAAGLLAAAK